MNTPAPVTPASPGPAAADVIPFWIAVPEADLADLRERLGRTRFPEPATVAGWEQGIPVEDLQKIVTAGRNHDWRATEDRLNALPHFRTPIDGLGSTSCTCAPRTPRRSRSCSPTAGRARSSSSRMCSGR